MPIARRSVGRTRAESIERIFANVRQAGGSVAPGLTAKELRAAEIACGAAFPTDYAALLRAGLPQDKWGQLVDWKRPRSVKVKDRLGWPLEGLLFDVKESEFWMDSWGPKPNSMKGALEICRKKVAAAPRLIPVSHGNYIPALPAKEGNPVFSVYQADIIVDGADLLNFFENAYRRAKGLDGPAANASLARRLKSARRIRFWTEIMKFEGRTGGL